MKNPLTFIAIFAFLSSCSTTVETFQTKNPEIIGIQSNRFRGNIFSAEYQSYNLSFATIDSTNRFTPTKEDIELAESIVRKQITSANKGHINQFGRHQYIDKNLNKYFRQYVGLVNKNGDRIIHINLLWDKFTLVDRIKGYSDERIDYTSDYSIVLDGGSRYWRVNVNLTTKELFGLSVNGVA